MIPRAGLALPLLLSLAACSSFVRPPELPAGGLRPRPEDAWTSVLRNFVDPQGRIDFAGLREAPQALEHYVAWIADHGPRSTPELFEDRAARLAYYVNAYNALAMYNVLRSGELPSQKFRFFWVNELAVDGDVLSLFTLENDVVRPLGEERVHFALNCMVRSCPRLPREPFTAELLETQLAAAAREFLGSERNVVVDTGRRRVLFNAILEFYQEDFLAVAPSLVAYANRHRDEPLPEDFEVGFLEYDWTLNQR